MPIWTERTSTLTLRNGEAVTHHFSYDKKVRSRWGLPVIRQRRHRRYRFRPWLGRAEREEEGQYTRLIPRLQLDDPMAYQNFILMPPELFQDREQSQVSSHSQTSGHWRQLHHPAVCLQGGQFDHQQVYA